MDQGEEKPLNFSTRPGNGRKRSASGCPTNRKLSAALLTEAGVDVGADQENGTESMEREGSEDRNDSADLSLDATYNASSLFLSAAPFLSYPYMQSLAAMTASAMMNASAYDPPALKQARLQHTFNFDEPPANPFIHSNHIKLDKGCNNGCSSSSSIAAAAAAMAVSVNTFNLLQQACAAEGSSPCPSPLNAGASPQANSASSSSSSLFCAVCSDVSSGKHYGILACNGCSGFFKRSVRRRLIYRCQAGTGACVVDKAHRNQCQACRLKKCLAKGMNKDAVQNERQPRNTATIPNSSPHSDFYTHSNLFPESSLASTLHLIHTTSNQSSLLTQGGVVPPQNLSSALDHLADHSSNAPASHLFNSSLLLGTSPSFPEDLPGRLLYMAVKWAKTMPSFSSLSMSDQLNLLEAAWQDLFFLSAFQWTIGAGAEKFPLIAGVTETDKAVEDMYHQFKHHSLDQGELACLKAICLFRPEVEGLQNGGYVQGLQDQAQIMLQQHSARRHATITRFGRLLLLLPQLRSIDISKVLENNYLKAFFEDKSVDKVIAEIYKS